MKIDFDLLGFLKKWSGEVDRTLDEVLPRPEGLPAKVIEAMRYSVFSGGKRFRPALCAASAIAVGGDPMKTLRAGAAIEMIHAYSLIHDDLPALDNDELRRGRPTCHKAFGEAIAILAGDGLLTEAFGVIAEAPELDAVLKVKIITLLAEAAGVRGMVAGQVVDMEKEGAEFNAADVEFIHLNKTAAMIRMAAAVGGLIGGGQNDEVAALAGYGRALGLAFQIADDVLNVTGGQDLGKGVGTDAERGKATWPALYGVAGSKAKAAELSEEAIRKVERFGEKAAALRALAHFVVAREK